MQDLTNMTASSINPFDECARQAGFGGLFDETLIPSPFDRLYRHHRSDFESHLKSIERIQPPDMGLRIEVEFANSAQFNAFTLAYGDQYFVGVPFGTVLILNDIFLRFMASRDVLSNVGDPASQPESPLLECIPIDAGYLPITYDNPLGLTVGPTDPVREAYAGYLIRIAFDFLFAHEYQHIEGGHLDWLLNGDKSTLNEFWANELGTSEALDQQVLEIDADAAAVRWSLKINLDRSNDRWRIPPAICDLMAVPENRLKAWLFAVGTLFRLMDETGRGAHHFTRMSHPPALMRLYFCFPAASYIVGNLPLTHTLLDLLPVAITEVDAAFRSIARSARGKSSVDEALSPEYPAHINKLINHWPAVRKDLATIAAKWGGSNAPDEYFESIPEIRT
ncbi:MAG TPA: hypothetical protein VGC66_00595 [Pyrinomonadaceae bacterium]|jgi:hypothetical protein